MQIAGMPDYDSATLAALEAQRASLLAVFAAAGYAPVEPPIIEPADVFVERSGEDIRRRMFVLADPGPGEVELCLRPDLTIPTCRLFLRRHPPQVPARLCYHGVAFRAQSAPQRRACQFFQAGIEAIGHADREAADAEVMALTLRAVEAAGLCDAVLKIGDLGLFDALLAHLPVSESWRERLRRHVARPAHLRALLHRLADSGEMPSRRAAFLEALGALGEAQARLVVEEVLNLADIDQSGGRSAAEIAERFLDQAADASAGALPCEIVTLIEDFLAIEGPPEAALAEMRARLGAAGLALEAEITRFERRLACAAQQGVALERLRLSAEFRSKLEYYTGFVFQITAGEEGEAIAAGGRYDALLRHLGAGQDIPAVGGAIRTELLRAAIEAQAARAEAVRR